MSEAVRTSPSDTALAVIPCLNERAHIEQLVPSLLADPGWADPLILIVDGGSTDGTAAAAADLALRDSRVRLLHNPKRVQSAAVNLAVRTLGHDRRWFVRIDAHAEYPPGYVSTLVREARETGAQSVVVAMQTRGRSQFQRAVALAQNSRLGTGGSAHRLGGPEGFVEHGHHALMERAAFLSAGGYDESFTHNEDAEFDARLRRRGGRIWLTRKTWVVYYPRSRPGPLFRQYYNYGRGRARTLLAHRERPRLRQILPMAVAPSLAALPVALAWPPAALPAVAWTVLCLVYGTVLAGTRRSMAGLAAGPAAMIMHAAWSMGFWRQLAQSRRRATGPLQIADPTAAGSGK